MGLGWADVSNSTRLNEFLDKFNLVLPIHQLRSQFRSKVTFFFFTLTILPLCLAFNGTGVTFILILFFFFSISISLSVVCSVCRAQPYRKLLNKVCDYYFRNVTSEHDKAIQFVNMISDLNMVVPIDRAVKMQAKHSKRPTFYYQCVNSSHSNFHNYGRSLSISVS